VWIALDLLEDLISVVISLIPIDPSVGGESWLDIALLSHLFLCYSRTLGLF
jgi:hypothetical protein